MPAAKPLRILLLGAASFVFFQDCVVATDEGLSPLLNANSAPSEPDADLAEVDGAIAKNPDDPVNYIIRGNLYARKKVWAEAQRNYEKALSLDPQNSPARIDIGNLHFRQKQYDQARVTFLSLETDADYGDLGAYMVFLCDLFGGHEDAATKELAAFNAVGKNASYYFANVAWGIVHHDMAGARDYLKSAERIYDPTKVSLYTINLYELGYLPLKD